MLPSFLSRILHNRLLGSSVFMGSILAASEFTQQTVRGIKLDTGQIARMAVYGAVFNGPWNFCWFKVLDTCIGGSWKRISPSLVKAALDVSISGPVTVCGFFTGLGILEGRTNVFDEVKVKFWPTYLTGVMYWIPVQSVNFLFVLPQYRVLYVGTAVFIWSNFLCYMKRKDMETK